MAISKPLVGVTLTWVRGAPNCEGCVAVELVHGQQAEHLQTLRSLVSFAHHARAFCGGLVAVAFQNGDVQENVGAAVVGNDEAVALRDVEPFDAAAHFDKIEWPLIFEARKGLVLLPFEAILADQRTSPRKKC